LGKDVVIDPYVPIVDPSNFYKSQAEADTTKQLYILNKDSDTIYKKNKDVKKRY